MINIKLDIILKPIFIIPTKFFTITLLRLYLLNPFKGRAEIAKILIAHGLDASDRHNDGYTPIHRACWGREARHTETGF